MRDLTDREKCAHLLRRLGLGASEAELDYYLQGGFKGAVEHLVNYDATPEGFDMPIESVAAGAKNRIAIPGIVGWWILRLVQTRRPLQEKMTLFWHNHFATSAEKVKVPLNMYQQNEIFRRNAVGNFRTLLSEVSKDPAMIVWLDNEYNKVGHANENFAREVMELFTLGIGHYTEKDIQESARAYTGWTLKKASDSIAGNQYAEFVYRPRLHDNGEKTFFGQTGNYSGDDILNMLCDNPRTAEYIAHKMWEFFAYRDPEPEVVERVTEDFRKSNLDIKTLILSIIDSPEFYSEKAVRTVYKNPVEFSVATARQLGLGSLIAQAPIGPQGIRGKLGPMQGINTSLKGMGMQLMYPPDVAGWDQGQAWITSATVVKRIEWAERLFGGGTTRPISNYSAYGLFAQDSTPEGVAKKLVSIFDAPLSESKIGQLAEAARKISGGTIDESNANKTAAMVSKLIFASPEFQFC